MLHHEQEMMNLEIVEWDRCVWATAEATRTQEGETNGRVERDEMWGGRCKACMVLGPLNAALSSRWKAQSIDCSLRKDWEGLIGKAERPWEDDRSNPISAKSDLDPTGADGDSEGEEIWWDYGYILKVVLMWLLDKLHKEYEKKQINTKV